MFLHAQRVISSQLDYWKNGGGGAGPPNIFIHTIIIILLPEKSGIFYKAIFTSGFA